MILSKQDKPDATTMIDRAHCKRWKVVSEGYVTILENYKFASFGAACQRANEILFAHPDWTVKVVPCL